MPTFTDAKGIERTIQLDPVNVQRIKTLFDVDLLDMVHGDLAQRLSENTPALMNVIGELAMPELSERQQAESLASDAVIPKAVSAFLRAVVDYLPNKELLQAFDDSGVLQRLTAAAA